MAGTHPVVNYIQAFYLQQQMQQTKLMLLAQNHSESSITPAAMPLPLTSTKKNQKLSFGMDTILGSNFENSENSENLSDISADSGASLGTVEIPNPPVTMPRLPVTQADYYGQAPFFRYAPPSSNIYNGVMAAQHRVVLSHKTKRNRTVFTNEQLDRLELVFTKSKYLVGNERTALAAELNLNETQVKVWFQNRRIKYRKQNKIEKGINGDSGHDSSNSGSDEENEFPSVGIKCEFN